MSLSKGFIWKVLFWSQKLLIQKRGGKPHARSKTCLLEGLSPDLFRAGPKHDLKQLQVQWYCFRSSAIIGSTGCAPCSRNGPEQQGEDREPLLDCP